MALVLMRSRFFEAVFRRSVGLDWLGGVGMTELYLGAGVFRAVVREKPPRAFHVDDLDGCLAAILWQLRSENATPCQLNLVAAKRYAKKELGPAIFRD